MTRDPNLTAEDIFAIAAKDVVAAAFRYDASGLATEARDRWLCAAAILREADTLGSADIFDPLIRDCITHTLRTINPQTAESRLRLSDARGRPYFVEIWNCPAHAATDIRCIYFIGAPYHVDQTTMEMVSIARERGVSCLVARLVSPDSDQNIETVNAALSACIDELAKDPFSAASPIVCIDANRHSSRVACAAALDPRISAVVCDGWLWDIVELSMLNSGQIADAVAVLSPSIRLATRNRRVLVAAAAHGWLETPFVNDAVREIRSAGGQLDILADNAWSPERIIDWIRSAFRNTHSSSGTSGY